MPSLCYGLPTKIRCSIFYVPGNIATMNHCCVALLYDLLICIIFQPQNTSITGNEKFYRSQGGLLNSRFLLHTPLCFQIFHYKN
jgi:hypothetical protein